MEKKYLNKKNFFFLFLLTILVLIFNLIFNHDYKTQIKNTNDILLFLDNQKNYEFENLQINTISPIKIDGLEIFFNGNNHSVTVWKPKSISVDVYHDNMVTTITEDEIPSNSLEIMFERSLVFEKIIIKNTSQNVFYKDIIFLENKKIYNIQNKIESFLLEFSDNPLFYSLATILFLIVLFIPGLALKGLFKELNFFYILMIVFIFFLIFSIISMININYFNIITFIFFLFFLVYIIANKIILVFLKKNYVEIIFFIFVSFYLNQILYNIDTIFRLDKQFFLLFSNLKLYLENNFTNNYGYSIDISLPYLNSLLINNDIGLFSEKANEIRLGENGNSFFSRGFLFAIFYQFFIEIFGNSIYVYLRFTVALIIIFLITLKRFFDFYFKNKNHFSYMIVILLLISPNYFSYFNFIELYPKYFGYIFLVVFIFLIFFSKSYLALYVCFIAGVTTHSSNLLFMTSLLIIDIFSKNHSKNKLIFYFILLISILIFINKKIIINYFFYIEYNDIYITQSKNILNLFYYDISIILANFLRIILPGIENINQSYYINIFFKYSLISFLFFPHILFFLKNDNYQKKNDYIETNVIFLVLVAILPIFIYLFSSDKIFILGGLSLTYILFSILSIIIINKFNLNILKIRKIKLVIYFVSIICIFLYLFLFYRNITLNFDAKPDDYNNYKIMLTCSYLILCISFIGIIIKKDKIFLKRLSNKS